MRTGKDNPANDGRLNGSAEGRSRERAGESPLTFDALVAEWVKLHLAHRRLRYAAEVERVIRNRWRTS